MSNGKHKPVLGVDPVENLRDLSISKALVLGIQHTFAMFGATCLVPLLTGLDISTTLFMVGLGTLLFHLVTKGKVPAFLGSSFAFIGGYAAVAPLPANGIGDVEKLAYASGGVFAAGCVYLVLAGLIKFFGISRVMRYFPPVVTGPIIIAIGLTLSPAAISSASQDWLLALTAIAVIVVCNIWGRGMVRIIPIILGIISAYVLALILHRVDLSAVRSANWFALPLPRESFMRFNLSAIITIMPIALATMMEHVGDISAIGATVKKNFVAEPGLHRTLLGDGLATMLASCFGGPANTTYGENTGVLVLTKVYDPAVTRLAACIAIILSFFPTLSAAIRTVPMAIVGGVSMILYGMISAIGVRNLVENQIDLTKSRNLIIVAAILVCALGFHQGIQFSVGSAEVSLSGIAIASLVGIILNAILPGKDYIFSPENPKETGVEFSGTNA
ncbi:MAG: uracil-xanthine permease family protein [Eubacteriales bacterium]|nr:uracil-xanthine permease family protein [Eubacteriales bacterium]